MTFPPLSLTTILRCDAASGFMTGALLLAGSGPVATLTGLSQSMLFRTGLALLPIAAFMLLASMRKPPAPAAVMIIILGNAGWSIASLLATPLGLLSPNGTGQAFLTVQAVLVMLFAILEFSALRRLGIKSA